MNKKILTIICCSFIACNGIIADSGEVLAAGAIGLFGGAALGAAAASHTGCHTRREVYVHHYPREAVVYRQPIIYQSSRSATIATLEREIDSLIHHNEQLRADNDHCLITIDELQATVHAIKAGQAKIEQRIARLSADNETLTKKVAAERARNKELQEEVASLLSQNKRLQKEEPEQAVK
ncbi:hypothetical protein M1466_01030 [Candidatus Dependentiae bacterium]|nr:hypothetical protein [Candidatus Dependentiae bacterium]